MQVRFTPNDINIIPRITVSKVPAWYTRGVASMLVVFALAMSAISVLHVNKANECKASGGNWVTPEGARKHIKTCLK